jgi:hypothetical protein
LWSALLNKESAFEGVWNGVKDEEKKDVFSMLKMWTGWTGAMHNETSLKWWGFEQEYIGNDLVVQPGYQKLVEWNVKEVEKAGGQVKLGEEITKMVWNEKSECFCASVNL